MARGSNRPIDFDRLRARVREKPRTKAGQVRQAWPEIRDLISAGHSLKDIWMWLNESGVSIGYARLSHYIGQLRKREEIYGSARQIANPAFAPDQHAVSPGELVPDPLANVREREQNRPGFQYNPQPDVDKLI